jgi:hypothetical protein
MLSVIYAECHLCWVPFMLGVIYVECLLCWVSFMLSVIYSKCHFSMCHLCCGSFMLSVFMLNNIIPSSFVMLSVFVLNIILLSFVIIKSLWWVSLWWASLCWVSLCWVSLCWMPWRQIWPNICNKNQTIYIPVLQKMQLSKRNIFLSNFCLFVDVSPLWSERFKAWLTTLSLLLSKNLVLFASPNAIDHFTPAAINDITIFCQFD